MVSSLDPQRIRAGDLDIAYLEYGPANGTPAVLMHGFPYDVHAYDEVAPRLAREGWRVIVPWLRGYGPTRFVDPATPRSGQQAALGNDLRALMDALELPSAFLGGYDWGGRAACVVAALWPERVRGLVSCGGYNVQNIARAGEPLRPEIEHRLWYQYYFHAARGHAGLQRYRAEIGRLLWQQWSPSWRFDDATFARTAASFDNPDYVDVVIQSYRHRFGLAPGDPALEPLEARLALQPPITVRTVVLEGSTNGVAPTAGAEFHARRFTGGYEYRLIDGAGHNVPQEAPQAFADAMLALT